MALSYANLTGSSASNALNKKLGAGTSLAPLTVTPKGAQGGGVIPSVAPQPANPATRAPATSAPRTGVVASNVTSPSPTPAPNNSDVLASLYAQLAEKQALLKTTKEREASEKKAVKTPEVEAPPTYGGLVGDLAKTAKTGTASVQTAIDQLKGFRENSAEYKAGIYSAPTSARVMQGRDAMVQQTNAIREAALQSGVASNIEAQGQQFSALGTAAGLAAPVQIAPGSTLSSPMDGSTIAGGLGGYANYQTAEQVMNLIRQYPDAGYIYDQTKTPQQNLEAFQGGALQGSPTYQKSTYGVPGAQSVAGGTATQAAQQGYTQAVQSYQNMNTAFANADGQAGLLLEALKGSGINASDARFANKTINEVRRQLSSSDLQVFDSALKATQSAYGNLLVSGGGTIPSESTAAYNIILNPNASLKSFEAALTQLKREGQVKLGAQGQQVNTYYGQLQAGSPGGQSAGGGSSTFAEEW